MIPSPLEITDAKAMLLFVVLISCRSAQNLVNTREKQKNNPEKLFLPCSRGAHLSPASLIVVALPKFQFIKVQNVQPGCVSPFLTATISAPAFPGRSFFFHLKILFPYKKCV